MNRFGLNSLSDLLIHMSALREYQFEEENQEKTTLINEVDEENQEHIKLEFSKTFLKI